jgi:hypothetical protein
MKNTYQKYLNIRNLNLEEQINILGEVIHQYPKLIDYVLNKVDSSYGTHMVYVVHLQINGVDILKIGYTKNSVKNRFKELRWKGVDSIVVKYIHRENTLQALGAKQFENDIKKRCQQYMLDNNSHHLPGKGEFIKPESLDDVLKIYDELYPNYVDVVGLKSPN